MIRKIALFLAHFVTGFILLVSGLIISGSILNKILLCVIGIFFLIAIWDHVKEIGIRRVQDE